MASSITDRDNGYRRTMIQIGKMARGYSAVVGVLGDAAETAHEDAPMTVGELAFIHELGLGVPQRSWLRSWVEANRGMIEADLRRLAQQGLRGSELERGLNLLGAKYAAGIQQNISAGNIEPPLEQSTIDRKGSSIPLIDTGQLRSAITWAVERIAGVQKRRITD